MRSVEIVNVNYVAITWTV